MGNNVGYFDGALATMYRDGRRVYPLYIPYGNGSGQYWEGVHK